jgi:hypothetical protein
MSTLDDTLAAASFTISGWQQINAKDEPPSYAIYMASTDPNILGATMNVDEALFLKLVPDAIPTDPVVVADPIVEDPDADV